MARFKLALATVVLASCAGLTVIGLDALFSRPHFDSDSDYSRAALRVVLAQTEDRDLVRHSEKLEAFRRWSDALPDRKLALHYGHWIDVIERIDADAGASAVRDARVKQIAAELPHPAP